MSWICTYFLRCRIGTVPYCKGSPTRNCLLIVSGRRLKASGTTQSLRRSQSDAHKHPYPDHHCNHDQITVTMTKTLTLTRTLIARSFILAYRIMKLIITENGDNAWLSHGTPHLSVRTILANFLACCSYSYIVYLIIG